MKSTTTLRHAFTFYQNKGGQLSYSQFRDVCHLFNKKAVTELLKGNRIFMKNRLGYLQVVRIPRSYHKPRVNWGESKKYREELLAEGKKLYNKKTGEGQKWLIYYTDEFFVRYYWSKKNASIKNKTLYRFDPSRGAIGAKTQLNQLLESDELAYLNFTEIQHV